MSAPQPEQANPHNRLAEIDVASILQNASNPRLHFPQEELEKLAQSIAREGVLVPVVVYGDGDKYRLIDGERRWRCSQMLGLEKIPAVITQQPDGRQNLERMFNIHMVREPWKDMPTAWALHDFMRETGIDDAKTLAETTGLSRERIQRLQHALELPKEYQKYIDDGSIPLNFFWELKKGVIEPIVRRRPALAAKLTEREILDAFVRKWQQGIVSNVVAPRKVASIVKVAERDGDHSPLDDTLLELVHDDDMSIEEAYEDTAEIVIEADRLERKSANMVLAFERLLSRAADDAERERIRKIGEQLVANMQALLADE